MRKERKVDAFLEIHLDNIFRYCIFGGFKLGSVSFDNGTKRIHKKQWISSSLKSNCFLLFE
jgi:hypothetical protein